MSPKRAAAAVRLPQEPKVVTGLWLARQMNRLIQAAESCPVVCTSDGELTPESRKWKVIQDWLAEKALEYADRLKKLREPKR